MNIVFFGSPQTAVLSLESLIEQGHNIKLVITQPDRPSGRGREEASPPVLNYARNAGIPVIQPPKIRKDKQTFGLLTKISPDLNVVVAYGQIIPSEIIYLPPHNTINVHFSLLPKYRGASPVQWALRAGEKKTGITIFELNERMDEGPILSQKIIPIHPGENAGELQQRLARIGAEFLGETISRIHELTPNEQNHAEATYAPLIKKKDGRINWTQTAAQIDRLVRAFTPWPSAFTFFGGKRLKVLSGNAVDLTAIESSVAGAGEIAAVAKPGITVACGGGTAYRIKEIHPENKKPMTAYAYSIGTEIQPGKKFE